MSLSFFCCLLLIRNVLTEVFGYVFALNFHVITPRFVWPGNWAASSLSLYSVSSWSALVIWVLVSLAPLGSAGKQKYSVIWI